MVTLSICTAEPSGGQGDNCSLKFPKFGQNSNFSGSEKKNIWAKPEVFGQKYEKFGKVRNFRSATINNCRK